MKFPRKKKVNSMKIPAPLFLWNAGFFLQGKCTKKDSRHEIDSYLPVDAIAGARQLSVGVSPFLLLSSEFELATLPQYNRFSKITKHWATCSHLPSAFLDLFYIVSQT